MTSLAPPAGNAVQSGGCYKCGKRGHWSRDCTVSREQWVRQDQQAQNAAVDLTTEGTAPASIAPITDPLQPVQKIRRKRPKLDVDRLLLPSGVPEVYGFFDLFKQQYKGPGHEVHDLRCLLELYQRWHRKFHPYVEYPAFLDQIAAIGASRAMGHHMTTLRQHVYETATAKAAALARKAAGQPDMQQDSASGAAGYIATGFNDDDGDEDEMDELLRAEGPTGMPDVNTAAGLEEDELDELLRDAPSIRPAAGPNTAAGLEEDELDELLREAPPNKPAVAVNPADAMEEDELDALLEEARPVRSAAVRTAAEMEEDELDELLREAPCTRAAEINKEGNQMLMEPGKGPPAGNALSAAALAVSDARQGEAADAVTGMTVESDMQHMHDETCDAVVGSQDLAAMVATQPTQPLGTPLQQGTTTAEVPATETQPAVGTGTELVENQLPDASTTDAHASHGLSTVLLQRAAAAVGPGGAAGSSSGVQEQLDCSMDPDEATRAGALIPGDPASPSPLHRAPAGAHATVEQTVARLVPSDEDAHAALRAAVLQFADEALFDDESPPDEHMPADGQRLTGDVLQASAVTMQDEELMLRETGTQEL